MRLLQHRIAGPEPCPYLPRLSSTTETLLMTCLNPAGLVGVGLADETPFSLSAVYCYHDPAREKLSIGTYSVLQTIEYARRKGLRHVYLGYRVEGCISLRYKGRFQPQESLRGRVGDG